jgi:membrane associated rhomboid family serine protease
VFPIRDDNPHFLTPYATYAIIALNAAAWVLLQGFGMEPTLSGSVCRLGLIPGELLQNVPAGIRVPLGPNSVCVIGDTSSWYTALTSMFMHGGWLHIIGNMWFLWIFGNNVEDAMGHARFVVFYLLCGLAAAAAQTVTDPGSVIPMVGASGAIGGVMGAYILLYPRVHVHMLLVLGFYVTTFAVPAFFMLGYWFLVQLLSGWASNAGEGGVAFWAHVGGFVAGAILVLVFRNPRLLERHPYYGWRHGKSPTRSWHKVDR